VVDIGLVGTHLLFLDVAMHPSLGLWARSRNNNNDNTNNDKAVLKGFPAMLKDAVFCHYSWSQHPAGEALADFAMNGPEVLDGSWYLRDRNSFENTDLDMLHDTELLGRSLVEAIEPKLGEYGLQWNNVVILAFGKGAGIALYSSLLKLFPKPVSAMVLFSPVVAFPAYLNEKLASIPRDAAGEKLRMFTVWGGKNRSTPGTYRQLYQQILRKTPEVHHTPDTLPDGEHAFDSKNYETLKSLLPLCLPR